MSKLDIIMGVIYKLTDEVVQFIISQRQENPLASCRQLAEAASQKFSLHLSKSSVHDVLKESGIVTPRGRKPKDGFKIPQDKKQQIQASLAQVKLLPDPAVIGKELSFPNASVGNLESIEIDPQQKHLGVTNDLENSSEYEGAGKIFLKAALWDLGIFTDDNVKASDWDYYLTYSKGIKIILENKQSVFIDLFMPIERCLRAVADGLVNNVRPFVFEKVSDENVFKSCMDAQPGFEISSIAVVDQNDHIIMKFSDVMMYKRNYINRIISFVECNDIDPVGRSKLIFFSQNVNNNELIENIMNLKGSDSKNKENYILTLTIQGVYENKTILEKAAQCLNHMDIRDDEGRWVQVKIEDKADAA